MTLIGSAATSDRREAHTIFVEVFTFLCYTIVKRVRGTRDVSSASLKRVTHSDTFRQAGKVPRGRCRGLRGAV